MRDEDSWKLVQEEARGTEIKEKLQNMKFKMSDPGSWPPGAPGRGSRPTDTNHGNSELCREKGGLISQLMEWKEKCEEGEAKAELLQSQEKNKMVYKLDKKDSRSRAYLRRLYQMHSASLANMEFSRRLLEGQDHFEDVRAECRAKDLLGHLFPGGYELWEVQPRGMRTEDTLLAGRQCQAWAHLNFLGCESPTRKEKDSNQKTRGRRAPTYGKHRHLENAAGKPAPTGPTTVPLTLEQVILTHRVVETKSASRYWTNYVD
ncbi:uncharacterized protein LOC126087655 [Elephas maximus indicus]|uniref:uncharacterized protein LOC126087655 n=1 Tax=Elephas maximus indicus TaxID=99487 RepID=UPI0021160465|nr:uncharacterized protein LOC126087655 [Elephas maximus indicus]